ncbi:MAG: 30S ribosomal protein S2 [Planctomycetota bacterium]
MPIITVQELIDNGVHFGHRTSRWNPKMAPYIYGKRNTIHIIDLRSTVRGLVRGCHYVQKVASEGRDVLFVGTKRGAKAIVSSIANSANMPCVVERWLGGTLTNFETIRRRLVRLEELEAIEESGEVENLSKKMLSKHNREKRKLLKNLGGIRRMSSLPGALIVVDPKREHIAVKEANRMGIPVISLIDTDCDPDFVDIAIPGNDDSMRSVETILGRMANAIQTGTRAGRSRPASAGSDEALADAMRVAGGGKSKGKKVVVRRRSGPAPASPVPTAPVPAEVAPAEAAPAAEAPAEPAPAAEAPAPAAEASTSAEATADKPAEAAPAEVAPAPVADGGDKPAS